MDDPFVRWEHAPETLRLGGDEVHVWGWSVEGGVDSLASVQAILSPDELGRMRAFRFAPDAERYGRSRAGLRRLLGRYLQIAPRDVRFVYGRHGKPVLEEEQDDAKFNLSHTARVAVAAFRAEGPVGIDIEEPRPVSRMLGEQIFSKQELGELQATSYEEHTTAFFNGWTRKEAIGKAEGLGFQLPMQAFNVSLLPGHEARLLDAGGVLTRSWRLVELPLAGALIGSLALDSRTAQVRFFRYKPDGR